MVTRTLEFLWTSVEDSSNRRCCVDVVWKALDLAMLEYKGYKSAARIDSYVHGGMRIVWLRFKPGRAGSIIEVARIEGKIFETMKEAEAHGLELAKEWVDKRWADRSCF